MNRKDFIARMGLIMGGVLTLKEMDLLASEDPSAGIMPSVFISHGSPMNAVADNAFTKDLKKLGLSLPVPKAILVVSAHWLTKGTFVATHPKPKTIHDFGGFPKELFAMQYPATGAPEIAKEIAKDSGGTILENDSWGLDHGAWSVLHHIFPKADIPVFQLSIDYYKPLSYHIELAAMLQRWRSKGIMMISSGNVTHNLGVFDWKEDAPVVDWAREFDTTIKNTLESHNLSALSSPEKWGKLTSLAHPSLDHYIPMLYASGLKTGKDQLSYIHEGFQNATLSMRSYMYS